MIFEYPVTIPIKKGYSKKIICILMLALAIIIIWTIFVQGKAKTCVSEPSYNFLGNDICEPYYVRIGEEIPIETLSTEEFLLHGIIIGYKNPMKYKGELLTCNITDDKDKNSLLSRIIFKYVGIQKYTDQQSPVYIYEPDMFYHIDCKSPDNSSEYNLIITDKTKGFKSGLISDFSTYISQCTYPNIKDLLCLYTNDTTIISGTYSQELIYCKTFADGCKDYNRIMQKRLKTIYFAKEFSCKKCESKWLKFTDIITKIIVNVLSIMSIIYALLIWFTKKYITTKEELNKQVVSE
ncbi:hypothetical protein K7432_010969 [Basidiobolus ranarum]|uniref:Transmembrane protein n=1 Tax=Basidiobolus ranarum TaxID=34480 RepID=A0ABR2VUQ7_9FUNG